MEKLLPCPFCGCDSIIFIEEKTIRHYPHIACTNCVIMAEHQTKEKLTELWNQRTPPSQDESKKIVFMAGFHSGRNANDDYDDEKSYLEFLKRSK